MIKLYAAIGITSSTGAGAKAEARVRRRGLDFSLDIAEFILWSSALWLVLSYDELKRAYAIKSRQAGLETRDFDAVLSELETRKLLISGAGETGLDALYDLMAPAFLTPFRMTLGERISGFFHLTLRGVPLRTTRGLFREPKRTGLQRDVWRLIKQRPLSTAEIIRCIELGVTDVSQNTQLVESIYSEEDEVDYKNIGVYSRLSDQQQPVLEAVTQLYLNKQVILDICN